jgi:hypothetical protein
MSIDNCQKCDKKLDTDFAEYQDDGTLLCDSCLDEAENEQESDKVYVKTDGPVPEYLTANKVYEVLDLDTGPRYTKGFGTVLDDQGAELVALIGLPTSHLYGGLWTLCDQHGNPVAEQQVTDWKALAGEIAAQCWCDIETKHIELDSALAHAFAKRLEQWMDTAAQFSRNADFYRGLVDQCAEPFGKEAHVSDDGSWQDEPVRLKIPELVRDAVERAKR